MIVERMFHINLNSEERDTLKRAGQILREICGEMEEERLQQVSADQSDWTFDDIEFAGDILEDITRADSLKAEE